MAQSHGVTPPFPWRVFPWRQLFVDPLPLVVSWQQLLLLRLFLLALSDASKHRVDQLPLFGDFLLLPFFGVRLPLCVVVVD